MIRQSFVVEVIDDDVAAVPFNPPWLVASFLGVELQGAGKQLRSGETIVVHCKGAQDGLG